ncbi:MAG TPA: hypothetical protein VHZ50_02070 [Puia sp.]|jgi:hypothetical protein|nr:hypothetical protein [Puia sp.]
MYDFLKSSFARHYFRESTAVIPAQTGSWNTRIFDAVLKMRGHVGK